MAKPPGKSKGKGGVTIIRREEVVEGGHHGGAWKVAYADFVTAMMAFFLLMWLLNATTKEQRKGLADYFAPSATLSRASNGSGQPFGGHTPNDAGSMVSDRGSPSLRPGKTTAPVAPDDADAENSDQEVMPKLLDDDGDPSSAQITHKSDGANDSGTQPGAGATADATANAGQADAGQAKASGAAATPAAEPSPAAIAAARAAERRDRAQRDANERAAMEQAADQIRAAVAADPGLQSLAQQLTIDITPEGLRIQLLDEDGQPMFDTGSSTLIARARLLLLKVAPILSQLSEPIAITGHTDATPYRGGDKTNWELSSDRANATRRLLVDAGVQESRFRSVTGAADRDPMLPATPLAAANRRIAIVVLRNHGAAAAPGAPLAPPASTKPISTAPGAPGSGPPASGPPAPFATPPAGSGAPASAAPQAPTFTPPGAAPTRAPAR